MIYFLSIYPHHSCRYIDDRVSWTAQVIIDLPDHLQKLSSCSSRWGCCWQFAMNIVETSKCEKLGQSSRLKKITIWLLVPRVFLKETRSLWWWWWWWWWCYVTNTAWARCLVMPENSESEPGIAPWNQNEETMCKVDSSFCSPSRATIHKCCV